MPGALRLIKAHVRCGMPAVAQYAPSLETTYRDARNNFAYYYK